MALLLKNFDDYISHRRKHITIDIGSMNEIQGQQRYQVLKHKYVGLGREYTTDEEWVSNVHRDTYYSLQAHSGLLEYLALAQGTPSKRDVRIQLIKKMDQCAGPYEN